MNAPAITTAWTSSTSNVTSATGRSSRAMRPIFPWLKRSRIVLKWMLDQRVCWLKNGWLSVAGAIWWGSAAYTSRGSGERSRRW